jgi:hypothetical protein
VHVAARHLQAQPCDRSIAFVNDLASGPTELTASNSASVLALSANGARLGPQMEVSQGAAQQGSN